MTLALLRHLAEHWPDVKVHIAALPQHWGLVEWDDAGQPVAIYLSHTLGPIERRVVLAHEIQHIERGQPCSHLEDLDEMRVRAATARWLLPDFPTVCAELAEHDLITAATRLKVTPRVLLDRLDDMNPRERDMLGSRIGTQTRHAS